MSVQNWEIKLRTNFTDRDKDDAAKYAVLKAARHLQVLMRLISDEIEPEICVIGNDWFTGAKEINLHEDILAKLPGDDSEEDEGVSDDMIQALAAMEREREKKQ